MGITISAVFFYSYISFLDSFLSLSASHLNLITTVTFSPDFDHCLLSFSCVLLPLFSTSQHATRPARLAVVPPRLTVPLAPTWPPYKAATARRAAKRGISSILLLESASVSKPRSVNVCVLFGCVGGVMDLYVICTKLSPNTLP